MLIGISCSRDNSTGPSKVDLDDLTWQLTTLDSVQVYLVAADFEGKVYADIGNRALYFSSDMGATWQTSSTNYDVINMAFRPNGDIYAFTNCTYFNPILRSLDGGISWQSIYSLSNSIICAHSILFHPSGTILIGDLGDEYFEMGGIFKSLDNLRTWERTNISDTLGVFCMAMNSRNEIFVGTSGGVFRSLDVGETWTEINNGLPDKEKLPRENYFFHLLVNPGNDYIFTSTYSTLFKSEDNGKNWTKTGLSDVQSISDIAINKDGVLFVVGWNDTPQNGVYYSLNNGDTWSKLDKEVILPKIFSITLDSNGYLYTGTSKGVYRTNKSTIK